VSACLHSPEVLSVNLGTREVAPDEARQRAAEACRVLLAATGPETIWIKKIDSRLKGPIAAEIAGVAEVLGAERVLLCPAIPELGRVVVQGNLRGDGVAKALPVGDTVALALPCEVPDAMCDEDLDRIAASWRQGTLVAAARGLASAFARRLAPDAKATGPSIDPGPIGLAIGSRDPVTLAQVARLRANGGPPLIEAPDGEALTEITSGSYILQATAGAGAAGPVVAARLAAGVTEHCVHLTTLVLSGGETAAAVLQSAGVRLLQVEGEVLPGVPLARALDRPGFPRIATKSGGFGPLDTLLRIWRAAQESEGCP
jgi:uncharacterized protein YgbK (DUF1537 family)